MKTIVIEQNQMLVGYLFRENGQPYELVGTRPHKRRDGMPSHVLTWRTKCADCDADVLFTTGPVINILKRRCRMHVSSGRAIGPRGKSIAKLSDAQLGALLEQMDPNTITLAVQERDRRRRRRIRDLRRQVEHGDADERRIARHRLRQMRVLPIEGVKRRNGRAKAEPIPCPIAGRPYTIHETVRLEGWVSIGPHPTTGRPRKVFRNRETYFVVKLEGRWIGKAPTVEAARARAAAHAANTGAAVSIFD